MSEDNPCFECGGACCSFRTLRISWMALDDGVTFDEAKDDLGLENLPLTDGTVPNMEWYVEDLPGARIVFECNHLEDGLCSVYDKRPEMCRAFECSAIEGEKTVAELKESASWDEGELEKLDLREITEEMNELIAEEIAEEIPA